MKKVVFLLVIFMVVTGAMFAQSVESIWSAIPAAAYTKADDQAVWTFATTGLTIRDSSGSITIPIRDMKNLEATSEGAAGGVSFGYDTFENKRTYRIIANPMTGAVNITITKNGTPLPAVALRKN